MKLEIGKVAKSNLRGIAAYIGRDNPQRAVTFINELIAKMETVAERPMSFPLRNEWRPNLRSALHQHYHIIFEITGDTVYISRVLHSARNISDIM